MVRQVADAVEQDVDHADIRVAAAAVAADSHAEPPLPAGRPPGSLLSNRGAAAHAAPARSPGDRADPVKYRRSVAGACCGADAAGVRAGARTARRPRGKLRDPRERRSRVTPNAEAPMRERRAHEGSARRGGGVACPSRGGKAGGGADQPPAVPEDRPREDARLRRRRHRVRAGKRRVPVYRKGADRGVLRGEGHLDVRPLCAPAPRQEGALHADQADMGLHGKLWRRVRGLQQLSALCADHKAVRVRPVLHVRL